MKCQFCGKNIDDIDCSCKMCTICGWTLDANQAKTMQRKDGDGAATPPFDSKKKV